MVFEQTFKNIDDILHKDAGCGSELDYVEQTSWVFSKISGRSGEEQSHGGRTFWQDLHQHY